ncbi:MAG: hypothetical protein ACLFMO_07595 [Eubacteriales bacterium]
MLILDIVEEYMAIKEDNGSTMEIPARYPYNDKEGDVLKIV